MSFLKKLLIWLLAAGMIVVGVIFALLNGTSIPLDLFFVTIPEVPVSLVIFASFAAGLIAGMLAVMLSLFSRNVVRKVRREPAEKKSRSPSVPAKA